MNLARKTIQTLKPYSPPLEGRTTYDGLLLDFNERSIAPPADVLCALQNVPINRYPEYGQLVASVASYCGVENDQVLMTNGSDQGIDVIFRTFTAQNDTVIMPTPGFAMTIQAAELAGNKIIAPQYLEPGLNFPLDMVLEAINPSVKLIALCNPNSPTGTLVSKEVVRQVALAAPFAVVMVDEAYFEFSGVTAAGLIKQYPNIIVTRTFSKAFGLAGLRIGYVIASAEHIAEMRKVCGPYPVSMVAQAAALVSLANLADMKRYVQEVMVRSKSLIESFFRQNGIKFYASSANFILFHPLEAAKTLEILTRNNILVRPQNKPGIEGALRLTIGKVAEMERFVAVYRKVLGEQK